MSLLRTCLAKMKASPAATYLVLLTFVVAPLSLSAACAADGAGGLGQDFNNPRCNSSQFVDTQINLQVTNGPVVHLFECPADGFAYFKVGANEASWRVVSYFQVRGGALYAVNASTGNEGLVIGGLKSQQVRDWAVPQIQGSLAQMVALADQAHQCMQQAGATAQGCSQQLCQMIADRTGGIDCADATLYSSTTPSTMQSLQAQIDALGLDFAGQDSTGIEQLARVLQGTAWDNSEHMTPTALSLRILALAQMSYDYTQALKTDEALPTPTAGQPAQPGQRQCTSSARDSRSIGQILSSMFRSLAVMASAGYLLYYMFVVGSTLALAATAATGVLLIVAIVVLIVALEETWRTNDLGTYDFVLRWARSAKAYDAAGNPTISDSTQCP